MNRNEAPQLSGESCNEEQPQRSSLEERGGRGGALSTRSCFFFNLNAAFRANNVLARFFFETHPPARAHRRRACPVLNALVGCVGTRRAEGRLDGRAGGRVIGWRGTLGESDIANGLFGMDGHLRGHILG